MKPQYDKMIYNRCGASGVKIPALSLGLWHNFGAEQDLKVAKAIILTAFEHGIVHFDLANNYGPPPGAAEVTFGRIFHDSLEAHRDEIFVSTKAGHLMFDGPFGDWGSRKSLLNSLDASLKRMNLDYVDLFYSHRFDPETPLEETMGALAYAVKSGRALYVGISKYPPTETKRACEILRQMGVRCLIHQHRYNIFDQESVDALYPTLEAEQLGMIAFCPLAQGLLTSRYLNGISRDSRAASESPFLNADRVKATHEKILALHQMAQNRDQTLAQMSIAWVLQRQHICSALIGVSRAEQLLENMNALNNLEFSSVELAQINDIVKS